MPTVQIPATEAKLRFFGSESAPTFFATNVGLISTDHEVTIAFFEAVVALAPELATQPPKEVPARCVARIAISGSRFDEIAELFTKAREARRAARDKKPEQPAPDQAKAATE